MIRAALCDVDFTLIQGRCFAPKDIGLPAREFYAEWASNHHFELNDVSSELEDLSGAGIRIGVISNSHRGLESFLSHFELQHLISAAVSSADHGFMKPHPSIFLAALQLLDVQPADAVMVGDNVRQDVEGALRAGMRAVLLHRAGGQHPRADELTKMGVPAIDSLYELPRVLSRFKAQ